MSKALSSALGLDMSDVAQLLRKKGRGKDTVLAHITPKEAALLKRRGGRGSINPNTGLPEFDDSTDISTVDLTQQQDSGGSSYNFGSSGGSSNTAPMDLQGWTPPTDIAPAMTDTQASQFMGSYPQTSSTMNDTQAQQFMDQGVPTPAPAAQQTQDNIDWSVPGAGQLAVQPDTSGASGSGKGWMDSLASALGTTVAGLAKAGILGGTAAYGASQGQTAAAQGQAAAQQIGALAPVVQQRGAQAGIDLNAIANATQQAGNTTAAQVTALGQPIMDVGTQMMQQAQGGALTPSDLHALDILRARDQQNIDSRGGVGAMQAGVAEETARSTMGQQELAQGISTYNQGAQYGLSAAQIQQAQTNLANTYRTSAINIALQQAGISDQYTTQAIMLALQNDQTTAANLTKLYTSLASIGFGGATTPTGNTTTTTTPPIAATPTHD